MTGVPFAMHTSASTWMSALTFISSFYIDVVVFGEHYLRCELHSQVPYHSGCLLSLVRSQYEVC